MEIEERISKIEQRNKRVELDKAWETGVFRKIIITLLTYITIVVLFIFADLPRPFVNSIIPALAFVLSTLSVPYFKRKWIEARRSKN